MGKVFGACVVERVDGILFHSLSVLKRNDVGYFFPYAAWIMQIEYSVAICSKLQQFGQYIKWFLDCEMPAADHTRERLLSQLINGSTERKKEKNRREKNTS